MLVVAAARTSSHAASGGPEGVPLENGLALTRPAETGASVDGVSCESAERFGYHIHARLLIYADVHGPVTAFVNGARFAGDPAAIPLAPHTTIELDVGQHRRSHPPYDWGSTTL